MPIAAEMKKNPICRHADGSNGTLRIFYISSAQKDRGRTLPKVSLPRARKFTIYSSILPQNQHTMTSCQLGSAQMATKLGNMVCSTSASSRREAITCVEERPAPQPFHRSFSRQRHQSSTNQGKIVYASLSESRIDPLSEDDVIWSLLIIDFEGNTPLI
jgi:hypothetical protein